MGLVIWTQSRPLWRQSNDVLNILNIVINPGQYYFRWWFFSYSAPSHYPKQYRLIIICNYGHKLRWNLNILFQQNAFRCAVCKTAYGLSLPRYMHVDQFTPRVNSSPPGQNGHHFADDIFRCIFLSENICIFIKISLKFVSKGSMDNNPVLV